MEKSKPILVVGGEVGKATAEILKSHGDDIEIVTMDELKDRGINISNIDKPFDTMKELEKELVKYPTTYTPPLTRRERRALKRKTLKK